MLRLVAKDIMRRDVFLVHEDAFISECINILIERRISGLPVVDAGKNLVGIVSQTDLIRHEKDLLDALRAGGHGGSMEDAVGLLGARRVRDVMVRRVVYADEDTELFSLVGTMLTRGIHRLLVTSGTKVVGIVTSMDVAGVLLRQNAAVKQGAEFRHEYSRIYSNKHERLVLRLEHIERMDALLKHHAFERAQEGGGGEPLSISDIVNACLDFVFERPIDFRGIGDPGCLRDLIAEEVCAQLVHDLQTRPAGQGIRMTRPIAPAAKPDVAGRTKDNEGTWPPRRPALAAEPISRERSLQPT